MDTGPVLAIPREPVIYWDAVNCETRIVPGRLASSAASVPVGGGNEIFRFMDHRRALPGFTVPTEAVKHTWRT